MALPDPSYNDDIKSFAYETVKTRWPKIIGGAIKDVEKVTNAQAELKSSGQEIVSKLKGLLVAFNSDEEVSLFDGVSVEMFPILRHYNSSLKELNGKRKVTWQTGPWLYLECYLYQLLRIFFSSSDNKFWHSFDVFEDSKNNTFKQSEAGVLELCERYKKLTEELSVKNVSQELLKLLFTEFIDTSLWGNATDLSLLAGTVSLEELKSVQAAEFRKKNEEKILVNDFEKAWNHLLSKSDDRRVDIVLDNAGFELFADLVLSLFLLDSGLVSRIHLHSKELPWFVSDVQPKDFKHLLLQLNDPYFFPEIHGSSESKSAIQTLHNRLSHYVANGNITIDTTSFWTSDAFFWDIPKQKALYGQLLKSDLIILKGDLNYRKLTGDLQWPKTTPFTTAIADLAKSDLPILTLRTCKADVVVGLPEGLNEKLIELYTSQGHKIGEQWTASGKWAVVQFSSGK